MTTCTDGSVRFGKPGCTNPEICIPPFKPICAFDVPRATEPMTLEAPHPRIVLPLPPSDCACFSFEEKNGTVSIKKKADKTAPRFTVEIKQASPDCCEGKYQVTPSIEIPECIMDDETKTGTCKLSGLGGTLNWTLKRTNCELSLEMSGNIPVPNIPGICLPTIQKSTTDVKIKYKENESDTTEKENANGRVRFKTDTTHQGECPRYIPEEIFLGVMPSGFSSGGDVFKGGGGSSGFDSGKAYLTGKPTAAVTWHGGGYGDLKTDNPQSNYCRGNLMRGGVVVTEYGEIPVTVARLGKTQQLVTNDGGALRAVQVWKGQRDPDDENPDPTPNGHTVGSGNLDIVMPTGSQWNKRGIALTLSQFIWNQSGLLSKLYEHDEAILVSPAPCITTETTPRNASGLAIDPGVTISGYPSRTSGMSVNAGLGLRISGTDARTPESNPKFADDVSRFGTLEIQLGRSLRTIKTVSDGAPASFNAVPSILEGGVEVNFGSGLYIHPNDSTARANKLELRSQNPDFITVRDEKNKPYDVEHAMLALDDSIAPKTYGFGNLMKETGYEVTSVWGRNADGELVLPVLCPIGPRPTGGDWPVAPAYIRILRNGVIVGIDFLGSSNFSTSRTTHDFTPQP